MIPAPFQRRFSRTLFFAFAFGAVLAVFPGSAFAVNYFNWGVEGSRLDYGVNGPGQYDVVYRGASVQDCAVAHSGGCSMRITVIGPDGGNQSLGIDTISQNPDYPWRFVSGSPVYYRWWMRIMPGFRWGDGTAKTKSSRVISGIQGYTGYLMDYGFLIGECASYSPPECTANDGSANDYNLNIPYDFNGRDDGLWHEYIVKVKPNTVPGCTAPGNCDASFEAWVDGVSVGKYEGFRLHNDGADGMTEAWGGWMVSPYFQMNGTVLDGGTIYLDDFSTDDVFNSTLVPADAVPPAPPRGLGVR